MTEELKMDCEHSQVAVDFLRSVGLEVQIVPGASGFIDHVVIVNGALHVDPQCPVSGVLHEAGHLAVIPSKYRQLFTGNLYSGWKAVFEQDEIQGLDPDHPTYRALIQSSDPEVTAWAWAAGTHLAIPGSLVIMDHEYQNEGADIRSALQVKCYPGINGLSHAGFCSRKHNPYMPQAIYPKLNFWLQP